MITARQTAAYLMRLASDEIEPAYLTHLHVQKLLYYVQGWSLAIRDIEVFDDPIVAWKHGPVVAGLYGQFKQYGDSPITNFNLSEADGIDANDRFMIASVWERYKNCSAMFLRSLTHREPPWLKARAGIPADTNSNVEITRDSMKKFFSTQIDMTKPVTTSVDWNQSLPESGQQPDSRFLEAVQSIFISDTELLKRLAS